MLAHANPYLLTLPSFPLPPQILRLLLALALAHTKVAGASEGPAALAKAATAWAPAFARAPPVELMPFMRSLISYPGGADVARPFSQQMLGALGRCLLAGESQCGCDTVKTPQMGGPPGVFALGFDLQPTLERGGCWPDCVLAQLPCPDLRASSFPSCLCLALTIALQAS